MRDREMEVLSLIVAGHSSGEIAALLSVSLATVKAHVNHMFAACRHRFAD